MNLIEPLRRLSSIVEPAGTVATVTLDLAGSGIVPPATRIFLKDQVARALHWTARPLDAQETLKRVWRRIEEFVTKEVRPETDGLFLVAGRDVWEAIELRVPLRNFVTVGRAPYLAPLLEAVQRAPRALLVQLDANEARVAEWALGEEREEAVLHSEELESNVEHVKPSRRVRVRTGASVGPGGSSARDRYQQSTLEVSKATLRAAAATTAALHNKAPAEAILVSGPAERIAGFRKALPKELEPLVEAAPDDVRRRMERLSHERSAREVGEFHERWKQGKLVALGPRDVLEHLATGHVARAYVSADGPVPGVVCPDCGRRYEGMPRKCLSCPAEPVATSLVQELVTHGLRHPPLAITYLPAATGWLLELGGMAALLSAKGVRSRRK